jgi:hypothetical protein
MFQSPPDFVSASRDLFNFFRSQTEIATFDALLLNLDAGFTIEFGKQLLGLPFRIINDLVSSLGNIYQVFFGYTAGSVTITAN